MLLLDLPGWYEGSHRLLSQSCAICLTQGKASWRLTRVCTAPAVSCCHYSTHSSRNRGLSYAWKNMDRTIYYLFPITRDEAAINSVQPPQVFGEYSQNSLSGWAKSITRDTQESLQSGVFLTRERSTDWTVCALLWQSLFWTFFYDDRLTEIPHISSGFDERMLAGSFHCALVKDVECIRLYLEVEHSGL